MHGLKMTDQIASLENAGLEIAGSENARHEMQARTLSRLHENTGPKIATVVCSERSYYYAEYYEVFCFWNI